GHLGRRPPADRLQPDQERLGGARGLGGDDPGGTGRDPRRDAAPALLRRPADARGAGLPAPQHGRPPRPAGRAAPLQAGAAQLPGRRPRFRDRLPRVCRRLVREAGRARGGQREMIARLRENPWATVMVVCLGFFMIMLDTTIVYVATPSMLTGLHASIDEVLWVFNGYLLAYAVLLITAGRLGDVFGPRNLFVAGLVVFTAASAACGFSTDATSL